MRIYDWLGRQEREDGSQVRGAGFDLPVFEMLEERLLLSNGMLLFEDWEGGIDPLQWVPLAGATAEVYAGPEAMGQSLQVATQGSEVMSGLVSAARFPLQPGLVVFFSSNLNATQTEPSGVWDGHDVYLTAYSPDAFSQGEVPFDYQTMNMGRLGPGINADGGILYESPWEGMTWYQDGIEPPAQITAFPSQGDMGTWAHFAFITRSDGAVDFYRDGQFVTSSGAEYLDYYNNPEVSLVLGGHTTGATNLIDNVLVEMADPLYEPFSGEIHGGKFHDLDADGWWEEGEPGLEGWTIFLDQNQNGTRDEFEQWTTTGVDGSYSFVNLVPDTYTVAELPEADWFQSGPANGIYTVQLGVDEVLEELNFGNYQGVIREVEVARGIDYEIPGFGDDTYNYIVDITGDRITGIEFLTPWGQLVTMGDLLPADWNGTDSFEMAHGALWFDVETWDQPNMFYVFEWDWLSDEQWTSLDTGVTEIWITYGAGETWNGVVDFSNVVQHTREPDPITPIHRNVEDTNLTVQWDPWETAPLDGEGVVWFDIEEERPWWAEGSEWYRSEATVSAAATSWTPPVLSGATDSVYELEIAFVDPHGQTVDGVFVRTAAFTENDVYFAAGQRPDDHGNTIDQATPIAVPDSFVAALEYRGDIDYFSFDAAAGVTYDVFVLLNGEGLDDSTLWIYDSDGTLLQWDDDGAPQWWGSRILWTAPSTGTYFLGVDSYELDNDLGSYTLTIAPSSLVPDTPDYVFEHPTLWLFLGEGKGIGVSEPFYSGGAGAADDEPAMGHVLDLGDPTAPVETDTWFMGEIENGDFDPVTGRTYLLDDSNAHPWGGYQGFSELIALDITPAGRIVEAYRRQLQHQDAESLHLEGTLLYVATEVEDGSMGYLEIYDVSDPTQGVFLGQTEIPYPGEGWYDSEAIAVHNSIVYSLHENGIISIIDASDPANPVLITQVAPPELGTDSYGVIEITGDTAWCGSGFSLVAFDLSDPLQPVVLDVLPTPGTVDRILLDGDRAYVACLSVGPIIVDISDPANLVLLHHYIVPGASGSLALQDQYLYVPTMGNHTAIFDLGPSAIDDSVTIHEDSGPSALDVLINDAGLFDPGETLSVIAVSDPLHGTAEVAGDGLSAVYTPEGDWFGIDTFTYTVEDTKGAAATGEVTVTVESVNDAPTASDQGVTVGEGSVVDVTLVGSDVETPQEELLFDITTAPQHGAVELAGNVATYTPDPDWFGIDTFTYTVEDTDGATATGEVTVTVESVNDAPTASDQAVTVAEDSTVDVTLVGSDVETPREELLFDITTAPQHGAVDLVGNVATYTPNPDWFGTDTFTYTVEDTDGATATGEVTVTVGSVNDAPTAESQAITVAENGVRDVTLVGNDLETPQEALLFEITTSPQHGTVELAGNVATYTPNPDWFGTDTFTYTVEDTDGAAATGEVTVTVGSVNDAPVAESQAVTMWEGGVLEVALIGSDTETPRGDLLFEITTSPQHGTVELAGNVATYTPDPDWFGTDAFEYVVSDTGVPVGSGQNVQTSAAGLVQVTVNPGSLHSAVEYVVTDLGTLGGLSSHAYSINASGGVAGSSYTSVDTWNCFVWNDDDGDLQRDPGEMHDLGMLGLGRGAWGWAINDDGWVAGTSYLSDGSYHAFIHTGSAWDDLNDGSDWGLGNALDINNSGRIVGVVANSGGYSAFSDTDGNMQTLGGLAVNSVAHGVNDLGKIVGWSTNLLGDEPGVDAVGSVVSGYLWEEGNITDLGHLGGRRTYPIHINNYGGIVGYAADSLGRDRAFLWNSGQMVNLGTLGGPQSWAWSINNVNQTVGWSYTSSGDLHAFLHDNANGMVDLNTLIPEMSGWTLSRAYDINDAGQIVGYGSHLDQEHAFLLTPASPAARPDLTDGSLQYDPGVYYPGGVIETGGYFANLGPIPTGTFNVEVHLSTDRMWGNADDIQLSLDTFYEGLTAGEEVFADDYVLEIPGDTPAGDYYLTVMLDSGNNVIESDENDNSLFSAQPDVRIVEIGDLFDEGYYVGQYSDVAGDLAAGTYRSGYEHFVRQGMSEGRNPSEAFDEQGYLNMYPDVAGAVGAGTFRSGFEHYLLFGQYEGRLPIAPNGAEGAVGGSSDFGVDDLALEQYMQHIASGGWDLRDFFDEQYYLDTYSDVAHAVRSGDLRSGLEHYLLFGMREGRNPSQWFDEQYYLGQYADVRAAVGQGQFRSGLEHYLLYGAREARNGSASFDEQYYLTRYADVRDAVRSGQFICALQHYLTYGRSEDRETSLEFDEDFYLTQYTDVLAAVNAGFFDSALQHYLLYGRLEGRAPAAL